MRNPAPGWWIIPLATLGALAWVPIIAGAVWLWGAIRGEVVDYDPGGPIAARAAAIRSAPPAEIRGLCMSACTMLMATGCVHPGAVLVFHGPVTDDPGAFEHYSRVMARHYPPAIADWFMAEGRFGGPWIMTGAEAIRLGARGC